MTYAFPDELIQAQRDWYAVYHQLAAADPTTPTAVLRRRLHQLSARVAAHPYWSTSGASPDARMALKQAAWATTPSASDGITRPG